MSSGNSRFKSTWMETAKDRHWMLDHQRPLVIQALRKSGSRDDVAVIVDCRGWHGKALWKSQLQKEGRTEVEAEEQTATETRSRKAIGQYPTVILVVNFETALHMMEATSLTARTNLNAIKRVVETMGPDCRIVVGLGVDGNTYSAISI
jgi:hypothetical protein